ncbi:MAG: hypothetical protein P1V34_12050 [Alphaproteobacteria bacterium]|nr:hypothetical protein [Alphaproteobacteria bacterium]
MTFDRRTDLYGLGKSAVVGTMLFAVAGCQTLDMGKNSQPATGSSPSSLIEGSLNQPSTIDRLVQESTQALRDNELDKASQLINLALKMDITNPDLQFLNGLTYHLMGTAGDASKFALAEQGYKQALKFDQGNLGAQYQLGLLYMDQRRFGLAQGYFAAVAVHYGDDPTVLYNLATASYYARDPKTADAALKHLLDIDPDSWNKPDVLKARALSLSAMDDRIGAAHYMTAYRKAVTNDSSVVGLEQRVRGWQSFYDTDAKVLKAQFNNAQPFDSTNSYSETPDAFGGETEYVQPLVTPPVDTVMENNNFTDSGMVVVDVVLIGTQEDIRDSRGINLLNGLQLQFGDPLTGTSGLGYSSTKTKDYLGNGLEESTQTITRMISIPAVTYSLNIANSADANNHVLAKPSLVAQSGETSEFFSGTEILAAAVSGGNGDSVSVQKEVGVKLAVTPEILPNDMLRLHVVAERTFLTDPSNSVVFEFRLDTTKTNVNSTVTMKFDETLILGGLSERETSKSADGVPGLMDIPGLNLLFSQRVQREFERSVLILITPRRPQYTRQAPEDRGAIEQRLSGLERDIERLEQRNKDWYTPQPTFNEILGDLRSREFFEEFRSGDISIQSWQNDENDQKHIAMIQEKFMRN